MAYFRHSQKVCPSNQRVSKCATELNILMHMFFFRPHRMHMMQTIATDVPIMRCVRQSVLRLCLAKTAERIWVRFGMEFTLCYLRSQSACAD